MSGINLRGILPYKNRDQRGIEQMVSGNLGWQFYLGKFHSLGMAVNYQSKKSKDETNFSFNQTLASVNYTYNFRGF